MTPRWNAANAYAIGDAMEDEYTIFNDALGTIDVADSTGMDEEKETGDAKILNFPTRED